MSRLVAVTTHRLPLAGRLRDAFLAEGYRVELVPDLSHLDLVEGPALLVLTGEREGEGLDRWIEAAQERLSIPAFTALPGPDGSGRGRRAGAEEAFSADPDPDEVALLGHRTIQRRELQKVTGIIGESDAIREVLERVVQIAPVDSTVLITGESGTGKELVARGIHALSSRRHRSFLAVNVAALSETLLESELFGHEKGAFTGAIDSRKGFFELAHKGTLFLDEIGEMPPSTQTKLLRVLEQREFLRVGGERSIEVDVRIIAATNQELRQLVPNGRFRRDLYYRLNILPIELPPLRGRREDIPRLVYHFVRDLSHRMDRPFPGISEAAMQFLVRYDWPGNIRELRNLVESMVVLSPGKEIGPGDIPKEIRAPGAGARLLPVPFSPLPLEGDGQRGAGEAGEGEVRRFRPELEFVFRTLVDLRVDVDQLRSEFELYREETGDRLEAAPRNLLPLPPGEIEVGVRGGSGGGPSGPTSGRDPHPPQGGGAPPMGPPEGEPSSGLVLRPGMTMDELEAEAIRLVLGEVEGNRRKAAESLGIGERTLYRKLKKYGIDG
jgi:DNA-binding NtrC family response regulator